MLPLTHVRSRLFGNFLVSVPYGNFGGIVTTDDAARRPLLDEAIRLAKSGGARWLELRHIDPLPLDLASHTRKVLQTLDLTPGPEELFKALASRTRNKIRKAEKNGIVAEFVGRERLDAFYGIFARRMRDLGTPVYPRRFFDVVWEHLGESLRLLLVRRENVVMGCMFLYAHRTQVEFPWTAASMEYADLYPNMLLYWEAIRDSAARGYKVFDFGTSDAGGGVHQFKALFNAVDRPLHRQYWLAPGQELPHLNPSNPRYAAKIRMWQKMPVWLTNIVGPMLARSLP